MLEADPNKAIQGLMTTSWVANCTACSLLVIVLRAPCFRRTQLSRKALRGSSSEPTATRGCSHAPSERLFSEFRSHPRERSSPAVAASFARHQIRSLSAGPATSRSATTTAQTKSIFQSPKDEPHPQSTSPTMRHREERRHRSDHRRASWPPSPSLESLGDFARFS